MLLVGDVGGTKTLLALYDGEKKIACEKYLSDHHEYASFYDLLNNFCAKNNLDKSKVLKLSLAVAGPIVNNQADITNLNWHITKEKLGKDFFINADILLMNDLLAISYAVLDENFSNYNLLHKPKNNPNNYLANKAIVAPGTGLGTSYLVFDKENSKYVASSSQGGHVDFAPTNQLQIELLQFMQQKYSQVSVELLCSGIGIPNIFEFLSKHKKIIINPDIKNKLENSQDLTKSIITYALQKNICKCCDQTIELFLDIFARAISNFAVNILSTGGIYLAGGITFALEDYFNTYPEILDKFIKNIHNNNQMEELLCGMPLYVINDSHIVLHGAYVISQNNKS